MAAKKVFIYALADPRVKHPIRRFFYVGATMQAPHRRLAQHLSAAYRGSAIACHLLIRALLRAGLEPSIHLLQIVRSRGVALAEKKQILRLSKLGAKLANPKEAGYSRKLSETLRLYYANHSQSLETRVKRVRSFVKAHRRPEVHRRHSEGIRKALACPEVRKRLRKAAAKRLRDPSYLRAHALGMKAAWSRGAWAGRRIARKPPRTLIHRRKLSAAVKAAWNRGAYSLRKPPRR